MTNYIRVAANVSDPFTKVTSVYSVAFKSTDGGLSGFYGNVSTMTQSQKDALSAFVKSDDSAVVKKRMFVPVTNRTESDVNAPMEVISYHDKVVSTDPLYVSPVESSDVGESYYVYIYIENASEFSVIQPSSVYIE